MASPTTEDGIVSTSRVNSGNMGGEDDEYVLSQFEAIRDGLRMADHISLEAMDHEYGVAIFTPHNKEGTLLHMILDDVKRDFAKYQPLVEILLSNREVVYAKNSYQETILYKAVRGRAYDLVRLICSMNHLNIAGLLALPTGDGTNCLHIAIVERNFDIEVLELLINLADDNALSGKDRTGKTALHLAVDYQRCTPSRVPIIKLLVEKFPGALEMETDVPKSLSPYRIHMLSRKDFLEKKHTARRRQSRPHLADSHRPSLSDLKNGMAVMAIRRPSAVPQKPSALEPKDIDNREVLKLIKAHVEEDQRRRESWSQEPNSGRGRDSRRHLRSVEERDEALARVRQEPQATLGAEREERDTKSKQSAATSTSEAQIEKAADEIREFMKLDFLRTRNDEKCIRFLYGPKQGKHKISSHHKEIYLNLLDHTSLELSRKSLEDSLGHLKFDDILRCVALPRIILHPDNTANSGFAARKGRSDVLRMFQYLKEDKGDLPGVKRVLRVIVEDLSAPSHGDEEIEQALQDLHVEDLDWKKYDMCPKTIRTAAPEAKRVFLYWSGSNAVLRAWSEDAAGGGLNAMLNLKEVRLCYNIEHMLEGKTRVRNNIKAFKSRLKDIKVSEDDHLIHERCELGHASGLVGPTEAEQADKWLTPMDSFADFIQNVKLPPKFSTLRDIVVGLIDDGVNLNERSLQRRVIDGRSFDANLGDEDLTRPYYGSSRGHGTAMASLICRLCPRAKLFVTRIESSPEGEISAESAAKAVRATIEQGVDIISMSWTIDKTSENVKGIEQLQDAIMDAGKRGILMFCAASDQGSERDHTYPGASNTTEIFKIGAAGKWGNASKMVGAAATISYLFPGEKVAPHRRSIDLLKNITLSGSSIATAIASGLAAMILFCVQIAAVDQRSSVTDGDYDQVKRHDGMERAFDNIGSNPKASPKYLQVWRLFDKAARKGDPRDENGKIQVILEVAATLVKGTKFEYD